MISIDQITTIADLCDFLDSAARIDEVSLPFAPNYYTLKLRDLWVRTNASPDRCSCGTTENEEYFSNINQLLPRLFDLDAFGWEFDGVRFDMKSDFIGGRTIHYEITLRREI